MAKSIERKKNDKRQSIMSAAYEFFLSKGIHKTSIDDIVKKANVAKGTFYLYFKDKPDLMQQLSVNMTSNILLDAYKKVKDNPKDDYTENVILFVDYIIEYFKSHKIVLKLIERNFSWPIVKDKLNKKQDNELFTEMVNSFLNHPHKADFSTEDTYKYLYSIIVLCVSICYSSIINNQPDTIENMKPVLYDIISKILK